MYNKKSSLNEIKAFKPEGRWLGKKDGKCTGGFVGHEVDWEVRGEEMINHFLLRLSSPPHKLSALYVDPVRRCPFLVLCAPRERLRGQ